MPACWTNRSKETFPQREASYCGKWRVSGILSFLRVFTQQADRISGLLSLTWWAPTAELIYPTWYTVWGSDTPAFSLLGVLTLHHRRKKKNINQSCSWLSGTMSIFCITPLAFKFLAQIMQFLPWKLSVIDFFLLFTFTSAVRQEYTQSISFMLDLIEVRRCRNILTPNYIWRRVHLFWIKFILVIFQVYWCELSQAASHSSGIKIF